MAYITLNKNNFFNNLDIIKTQIKSIDKIALVLKDNAYGHGLSQIANLAKEYGIKKAVVRTYEEALHVESFFEYVLILADLPHKANEKFRYTINDINNIDNFPKGTKVELKVDTSMNRNGISTCRLQEAFEKIKKAQLSFEAVFTHHRSADELTSEWFVQNEIFKTVKNEAQTLALEFGFVKLRFHSANSASLFRHQNFDEDMARIGIAAYGCMELPNALHVEDSLKNLKPVLSVYANKISSRELKKGKCIGYGATFSADEDLSISNYDFGYADGFMRVNSNNYTTPNGEQLLGRISMDNSSFVSKKDKILIFNDAREIAKTSKTISYEVLTSLKQNLKRVYV